MHIRHDGDAAVDVFVDGVFGIGCGRGAGLFVFDQGFGDDAVDGGGAGEGDEGLGQGAHEADGAAAVDERDVVVVQALGEGAGGGEVGGGGAGVGSAAGGGVGLGIDLSWVGRRGMEEGGGAGIQNADDGAFGGAVGGRRSVGDFSGGRCWVGGHVGQEDNQRM